MLNSRYSGECSPRISIHSIIQHRLLTALRISPDRSDKNISSSVETYPLNQNQTSIFTKEMLKLACEKGQVAFLLFINDYK